MLRRRFSLPACVTATAVAALASVSASAATFAPIAPVLFGSTPRHYRVSSVSSPAAASQQHAGGSSAGHTSPSSYTKRRGKSPSPQQEQQPVPSRKSSSTASTATTTTKRSAAPPNQQPHQQARPRSPGHSAKTAQAAAVLRASTRAPPEEENARASVALSKLPDTVLVQLYDYKGPRRRYVTLTFGSDGFHLERMCRDVQADIAQEINNSISSSTAALPAPTASPSSRRGNSGGQQQQQPSLQWTLTRNKQRSIILDVAAPQHNAGAHNDTSDAITTTLLQSTITHVESFGYGVSRAYVTLTPDDRADKMVRERLVYHYFLFRKLSAPQLDFDEEMQFAAAATSSSESTPSLPDIAVEALEEDVDVSQHQQQQQQQLEAASEDENEIALPVARTQRVAGVDDDDGPAVGVLDEDPVEELAAAAVDAHVLDVGGRVTDEDALFADVAAAADEKTAAAAAVVEAPEHPQQQQRVVVATALESDPLPMASSPKEADQLDAALDDFDFFEIPEQQQQQPSLHVSVSTSSTLVDANTTAAEEANSESDAPPIAAVTQAADDDSVVGATAASESSVDDAHAAPAFNDEEGADALSAAGEQQQEQQQQQQQQPAPQFAADAEPQESLLLGNAPPPPLVLPARSTLTQRLAAEAAYIEQHGCDDAFDPEDLFDDQFRLSEIELPAVDDVLGAVLVDPPLLLLAREELELLAASVDVDLNNEEDANDEIVSAESERQHMEDPEVWLYICATNKDSFPVPNGIVVSAFAPHLARGGAVALVDPEAPRGSTASTAQQQQQQAPASAGEYLVSASQQQQQQQAQSSF